jgi:hypothetical protein
VQINAIVFMHLSFRASTRDIKNEIVIVAVVFIQDNATDISCWHLLDKASYVVLRKASSIFHQHSTVRLIDLQCHSTMPDLIVNEQMLLESRQTLAFSCCMSPSVYLGA